jgi:hypothetical protein
MELGRSCDDAELNARIKSLKANQCCTLVYTVSIERKVLYMLRNG